MDEYDNDPSDNSEDWNYREDERNDNAEEND